MACLERNRRERLSRADQFDPLGTKSERDPPFATTGSSRPGCPTDPEPRLGRQSSRRTRRIRSPWSYDLLMVKDRGWPGRSNRNATVSLQDRVRTNRLFLNPLADLTSVP